MRLATISLATLMAAGAYAQSVPAPYDAVLQYLGKTGDYKANVFKVNVPRNDLKMKVDGVDLPTPFGFGGWLGFTKGHHDMDVMMGDLVLLQEEVNPVMSALLDNGLEVTALHNHFFWDDPKVYYMHVHGMGTPDELAHKVKPALDLIGHVPAAAVAPAVVAADLNVKSLDAIVGSTGDHMGKVYKYTIGRGDLNMVEMGGQINARMGLNTWAAFYGSDDNAVVAGDIAMLAGEVTRVLKALRSHNLNVVAIHHHMTGTEPMIIFLHYWGRGSTTDLAKGFRAALDELGPHAGRKRPVKDTGG